MAAQYGYGRQLTAIGLRREDYGTHSLQRTKDAIDQIGCTVPILNNSALRDTFHHVADHMGTGTPSICRHI